MKTIADLKIGETGIIKSFKDHVLSLRLLEMGCLPNTEICLKRVAPLGDPICIEVSGYNLSLRKADADNVLIR